MKFALQKLARIAVAGALPIPATVALSATFRSADVHPKDYPTVMSVMKLGKDLSKATNG